MIRQDEIAYCGILGAAAMLLPAVFHLFNLSRIFMPMYLPLVLLGFFVRPAAAGLTSFIVPVLSGMATGMPPFYPPVALIMSLELCIMSALVSWLRIYVMPGKILTALVTVLMLGRALNFALSYAAALLLKLPAAFISGLSFLSGWPGIVLMLVVIPQVMRLQKGKTGELLPEHR